MLYCKADGAHSTKYALECLYQFFLVYVVLSPRDSERFTWNRSVNNTGQKGANIPLDEDTEHSNNFTKRGIKNLGPNLTEGAVQRLSHIMLKSHQDQFLESLMKLSSARQSQVNTHRDLQQGILTS